MTFTNEKICTDNYGSEVYRCHYIEVLVYAENAVIVGAIIPGVKAKYVISDIKHHIESRKNFDETEANCNTCKSLCRVKHNKCKHGFLYGNCAKDGRDLMFHPDDWMGMECYSSR